MSLQHLTVPESEEVLKKIYHNPGCMSKCLRSQLKVLPIANAEQFGQKLK